MNPKHIIATTGIVNLIICGQILPTDYYIKVVIMTIAGISLLIVSDKLVKGV